MTRHQVEEVVFAKWGYRVAVLAENGKLEMESDFDAEQYGGLIPAVGDTICAIGPGRYDGHPLEVLKRFYVSEFGGETCWWLIARVVPVDDLVTATFKLARKTTKARLALQRQNAAGQPTYDTLLEVRERMAAKSSPSTRKRSTAAGGRKGD